MTTEHLTTLDPAAGHVTIINTYVVDPARAEELLSLLARATVDTLRHVQGFISANFHLSVDRTQLVNYAQWRSTEALAAARDNPSVTALIGEAAQIAISFTPVLYALRQSIAGTDV